MDDTFKIFIDQLREGHAQKINESVSPDFLQIHEKDLRFKKNIEITGETYLATDHLVIHLDVQTEAELPCAICNEWAPIKMHLSNLYFSIPLKEVKGAIYDFKSILREEILLEVPQFAECEGGCPVRENIKKYLKENPSEGEEVEGGYHPFADL